MTLAAAYHPSSNRAAVIVFPGRLAAHTEMFSHHGYGILILTPRGRDASQGDPPYVWEGEEDLRAAVRYLQSRPDVDDDRIGGLGISNGGLLMIQTAANEPALRAVVSEGGSLRTIADHVDAQTAVALYPPLVDLARAVFSDSLPPAPIPDLIAQIAPRPVLLIWGPEELNTTYHMEAGEPKTIWEIPESEHGRGIDARPEEYERRVVGFFDRALLATGPSR